MAIYTSRINYSGDKTKIDITAKSASGIGRHFKPTWDMVMGYKNGKYSKEEYTRMYMDILEHNYYHIRRLIELMEELPGDIVFICYCRAGDFCHRVLLAKYISGLTNIKYNGEI